jgi:hypothetical protein
MTEKRKNLIPFTPIGKSFIIEIVMKDTTDGGLLLPNGMPQGTEKDFKGYLVLATGALVDQIQPGDTVLVKAGVIEKGVGHVLRVDGKEVTLVSINEYDVFAVRDDVPVVEEYTWQSNKVLDVASK